MEPVEAVLAECRRIGTEGEVFLIESNSVTAELKGGSVSRVMGARESGLGIRVIRDGCIGTAGTHDPSRWKQCLDSAIAASHLATPQEWPGLPGEKPKRGSALSFDPDLTPDPGIAAGLLAAMKEGASRYPVKVTSGSAVLSTGTVTLANTSGFLETEPASSSTISLETIEGRSTGYDFDQSRGIPSNPHGIGEKAAFLAHHCRDGTPVATGDYDIILSPQALSQLVGMLLFPALSGRNVHTGRSRFANALGTRVADPRVTLRDEPHLPMGPGSTWWDAEGDLTTPFTFIEEGILRGFAYDRKTAGRFSRETTASAVRSGIFGSPGIGYHNLVLSAEGALPAEKGVALYINDLIGAHTANPVSGDLSVELSNSYWQEDSVPGTPVKSAMLSGNLFSMFLEVGGAGPSRREVGSMLLPPIKFNNQRIIGE